MQHTQAVNLLLMNMLQAALLKTAVLWKTMQLCFLLFKVLSVVQMALFFPAKIILSLVGSWTELQL